MLLLFPRLAALCLSAALMHTATADTPTAEAETQAPPTRLLADRLIDKNSDVLHPDLQRRSLLVGNGLSRLDLIAVAPAKPLSGGDPEAQAVELADTLILMQGGLPALESALVGRTIFGMWFTKQLSLPVQKCISDHMRTERLYPILLQEAENHVRQEGSSNTAQLLRDLLETGFAQHWHNLNTIMRHHPADSEENRKKTARDYLKKMEQNPQIKQLLQKNHAEDAPVNRATALINKSVQKLTEQAGNTCQPPQSGK